MNLKPAVRQIAGKNHRGSTLVDLVAVVAMLAIVGVLVVTVLQQEREASRKATCQNNIRNIGIAIVHYHDVHKQLPIHGTGTHDETSGQADAGDSGENGSGGKGGGSNGKSLSFLVAILPQLNQQTLWETISQSSSKTVTGDLATSSLWPPMGPATGQRAYPPWVTDLTILRCPTDPRKGETTGRTNYAASLGDAIDYQMDSAIRFNEASNRWKLDPMARKRVDAAARGAFVFREAMKLSDITDGLSNTILVAEIATDQGDRDTRTSPALGFGGQSAEVPARGGLYDTPRDSDQFINMNGPQFWNAPNHKFAPKLPTSDDEFRGMRWADARAVFTGFNTILPINSSVQIAGDDINSPAVASPSSGHHGGAHALMADGSTQYYTNSINAGDVWGGTIRLGMTGKLAPGSPSPFGPWGAMGTRAANDDE